jgi:hypothetical protein
VPDGAENCSGAAVRGHLAVIHEVETQSKPRAFGEISSSHNVDYGKYGLIRNVTMHCGRNVLAFRGKLLLPSSGSLNKKTKPLLEISGFERGKE